MLGNIQDPTTDDCYIKLSAIRSVTIPQQGTIVRSSAIEDLTGFFSGRDVDAHCIHTQTHSVYGIFTYIYQQK